MIDQQLKTLVTQGLEALHAGSQVAARATSEIENDASHPDLKSALRQGNETSQRWAERIERALREAGGDTGAKDNPILQAHYEVGKRIRQQAEGHDARDLGIIAAGQLALHYWIAAFGTLRTYAGQLGLDETEQALQQSLDEAKQADQQHTDLAESLMRVDA